MFEGLYRHDGWNVGLIAAPVTALLTDGMPKIDWMPIDGRAGFAADPFLIREDGALYCFFESLPYATNRGKICFVRLDERAGGSLRVHDAIVEPHHLSYPYLLRHQGRIVCVPEAHESGCVGAYVAHDFPHRWHRERTLIEDFPAIDPTLFEHAGRWWMFATDARNGGNSELHVWYADDLFGTWRPHARNPVKRSLGGARPGGAPFVAGGKLYRPAQDCTVRYGRRLVIHEVLELTPERFSERIVNVVEPDPAGPYADGLHTANGCHDITVVDGNHLHFVGEQALRTLKNRWNRIFAER